MADSGDLLAALAPRPGLSARLADMATRGPLDRLMPEILGRGTAHPWQPPATIAALERLRTDRTLAAQRFGPLIEELPRPGLLVLALLLRPSRAAGRSPDAIGVARTVLDRSGLPDDERHVVEFLVQDDLTMARVALRPEADDPQEIESFAAYLDGAALFNTLTTEDHLKMLGLLTLVTLEADGALTPLKAELLWRLFVDTYNHLTKAYGDQVIDAGTISGTALMRGRPAGISESELVQFVAGLPKRYLTLFSPERIYEHVRAAHGMSAEDVAYFLHRSDDAWELTVATLDKHFLFSNVCGVLTYLGVDILEGQALTSTRGLVVDAFRFRDPQRVFQESSLDPLLKDAISGRVNIADLLAHKHRDARSAGPRVVPVIAFDNEASHRFTVLEIVAADSPGLLYRISRALSTFKCEIEMVVISTEGGKAVDVFHVRRDGRKLQESDELPLTEALEQAVDVSAV